MADRNNIQAPAVDIVIPVYRDLAVTRRCVESVLANTDMARAQLLIVDDASPEAELSAWCASLDEQDNIQVLRHEDNKGFVAAANLGMSQSDDRDVVLLNSDTEVPAAWLARLQSSAYAADDIATVTPFSNNGSVCSYPTFCQPSELPEGIDLKTMDALFARANRGQIVDLPTAVGFCMYIRRSCLSQFGLFDEAEYGRGYGEENDFSLRVAAQGWRNCLCADLFVYHQGAVSFGDDRHDLMASAEAQLGARYPAYARNVAEFIAQDPLRPLRDAVDVLRLDLPDQVKSLLAEARRNRDWLHDTLQKRDSLLEGARRSYRQQERDYGERCRAYERLLTETRDESNRQIQSYEKRCASYEQLLAEARKENQAVNEALGQLQQNFRTQQQALEAVQQKLAKLQELPVLRLGRWIKRNILRQ